MEVKRWVEHSRVVGVVVDSFEEVGVSVWRDSYFIDVDVKLGDSLPPNVLTSRGVPVPDRLLRIKHVNNVVSVANFFLCAVGFFFPQHGCDCLVAVHVLAVKQATTSVMGPVRQLPSFFGTSWVLKCEGVGADWTRKTRIQGNTLVNLESGALLDCIERSCHGVGDVQVVWQCEFQVVP